MDALERYYNEYLWIMRKIAILQVMMQMHR